MFKGRSEHPVYVTALPDVRVVFVQGTENHCPLIFRFVVRHGRVQFVQREGDGYVDVDIPEDVFVHDVEVGETGARVVNGERVAYETKKTTRVVKFRGLVVYEIDEGIGYHVFHGRYGTVFGRVRLRDM